MFSKDLVSGHDTSDDEDSVNSVENVYSLINYNKDGQGLVSTNNDSSTKEFNDKGATWIDSIPWTR